MALGEHLGQFLALSLAAYLENFRSQAPDSGESLRVDVVLESRRESDGPHHAELVFAETTLGVADAANEAPLKILLAADVVENTVAVEWVQHKPVDGEVAALD